MCGGSGASPEASLFADGIGQRPSASEDRWTVLLAGKFVRISLLLLDLASSKHARLSLATWANRRVTASRLISIFIDNTPQKINVVLILTAFSKGLKKRINPSGETTLIIPCSHSTSNLLFHADGLTIMSVYSSSSSSSISTLGRGVPCGSPLTKLPP